MTTFDLQNDRLLSIKEVAQLASYSEDGVRDAISAGRLKALQAGGKGTRIRVPVSAVYEWLGHDPTRRDIDDDLDGQDWSEPAADRFDPNQDFIVCDEYTDYTPVHASRLSEFFARRTELARR